MSDIKKFEWLAGQWEGIMGTGIYHEEWTLTENNELTGRAYLLKQGEISNNEKLMIHQAQNEIYYTADVSHNPSPVSFKLTYSSDTIFIFENPEHDFPKKITYEIKDENNFIATVEADMDGRKRKLIYDLKRLVR